MKLSEFDYSLPKELIAEYPSERRGEDRLLVLDRSRDSFQEKPFGDIADYFREGDLLVLNDTKVIPARLFAKRKTGGNVEIFILDGKAEAVQALVRPSGRVKQGETVTLESGENATVLGNTDIGREIRFEKPVREIMRECGHVPLPPYIKRPDEDSDKTRYQTVYAQNEGATASPTAGLHFTEEALSGLRRKGVEIACITLHVSYGTFAPVKEENIEKHRMHSEFYRIPKETSSAVNAARDRKARIFACGTTTLRTLETTSKPGKEAEGFTDLFIYPGYKFKIVDALITNFHLPKSTLLMLASAFAGRKLLFRAYEYAARNKFKFFSYGDAMLII